MRRCTDTASTKAQRRFRQEFQPGRLLLPSHGVGIAERRRHARVTLAAEFDELAQHQRRLGPADSLRIAGREVVDLEADRRIGHRAGLLAAALRHADVAVGDVQAGIALRGLQQGLPKSEPSVRRALLGRSLRRGSVRMRDNEQRCAQRPDDAD